ncbi:MAG: ATP-binding protein [Chloroflexota bacterium]
MNRLWIRLSVAFSAVVLLGVIMVMGTYVVLLRFSDVPLFASLTTPGGIVEHLENYYHIHQSWNGIQPFLDGVEAASPDPKTSFSVKDSGTSTQYSSHPDNGSLTRAIPLIVDGQERGTLNIFRLATADTQDREAFFLARIRDFLLLVALVGGVVGIIFGVLVSRTLTAPLEQLAKAARAIGTYKLYQRVTVRGSNEITDVAHAFNDMAEALEQAEILRRNLVADVAHELRTPLTVLQGNLLAILDHVYPLEIDEIARLYSQTHVLSRLVNDLHELSLAEARQLHLNVQSTDVTQFLTNIMAAFGPTAETAEVKLDLAIAANLPPVQLDPLRMTQVLDNLLGNALRHTPVGGTITLCADVQNDVLQLSVKDTGEGVSAEHLPHIFDRFYRTNQGRSRATGGAGLGLAIVRAVVEMHDGKVTAYSDGVRDHGTTFTVQLPLKPA